MKLPSTSSLVLVFLQTVFAAWVDDVGYKAGIKFLKRNAKEPGWRVTKTGLQYLVLNYGPGRYHPALHSECYVHYELTLIDGSVVDSSIKRGKPERFSPISIIPGWTEALQMVALYHCL